VIRRSLIGLVAAFLVAGCASVPPAASTVSHKFGETVVPARPKRVVSLGYTDQDAILAFGVVPVAVRHAFGPEEDAIFPWADAAAGEARPVILPRRGIDFEQIAALQPDLIMAVTAGLDQQEYDTLSRIAPTVAQPAEVRTRFFGALGMVVPPELDAAAGDRLHGMVRRENAGTLIPRCGRPV
jgi:iron complex transport system substrate-binding protein